MKLNSDTICAISTPPGVGGIAVARVSGPQAIQIAQRLWHGKDLCQAPSHTAHLGEIMSLDGEPLDQGVATVYRAPRSFTGEDVVEIAVHGSLYVQQQLITTLIEAGARLAEPGEFTRRAFASGRLDLAQAEAVADVIASTDRASHRLAVNQMRGKYSMRLAELRDKLLELASLLELELDFSEEDVEFASRQKLTDLAIEIKTEVDRLAASFRAGNAIKHGIPVAIVGATNAGKSSLLNALLGDDRAIVSDIHGTTRDIVEDTLRLGDYTFRIMDTAGLRDTSDTIETLGIERSRRAARQADIIIHVIDATDPQPGALEDNEATIITVVNKQDLLEDNTSPLPQPANGESPLAISAKTGQNIPLLKQRLVETARASEDTLSSVLVTNARHYQALLSASASISDALASLSANLSGDLIALDIRLTIDHLNAILGQITSADILSSIFSRFCIGK